MTMTVERIDRFTGNYSFLSNFYESPILLPDWHPAGGLVAPTVEHAFQAAKCTSIGCARMIAHASSPGVAKRLGRGVSIREGWDDGRRTIMLALLRLKFVAESELARQLLETGSVPLIEGNTWGDRYWGQVDGVGENHLGLLLVVVRAELDARPA